MSILTNYLISLMIKENVIKKEDEELYRYGLYIAFKKLFFYAIIIGVCAWVKSIFTGITMMFFFSAIREYSGGFHCKKSSNCMVLSISSILVNVLIIKYKLLHVRIYRLAMLISTIALIKWGPIDCDNKRIDEDEKKEFYKLEIRSLLLINCLAVSLMIIKMQCIEKAIEAAVGMVAVTSMITIKKNT